MAEKYVSPFLFFSTICAKIFRSDIAYICGTYIDVTKRLYALNWVKVNVRRGFGDKSLMVILFYKM